ncbi:MAG: aminopeptidase N [Nocardioides sp.]
MNDAASLTRLEAEERGALIAVDRYDISVDMRGLWEGETIHSTSTISFSCREPGAATFVDCALDVREATLNGRPLDVGTVERGRLRLPDLAADNVLVVSGSQSDTGSGAGILRTVDPSDKLVYVWTSFEADDARRVWACFDQPDLKAPHAFTVLAPETWTVTSNGAPDGVTDAEDGGRVWTFPDTPPLSTYVVVVNAGPFHEIREERGGHSLGLYCRQSLKQYLERDAQDLLASTEAGLAFFGERFGMPFPQERYDQVFVPNMGGAMENWACVTWTDAVLHRSTPTHGQRALVASVLLHEMAHMWFGDLVTMQWWDDLWLNEAFASWAATWASVNATPFTDGWATFLAGAKLSGYQMDMGPATHAIRGDVPDVAQAMANFDAITYVKGESVLKQLVAFVGEDTFVEGLRAYFRDHAWGNTRLADLMSAVGTAAGRDLSTWTTAWFDRAGTDTLTLTGQDVLAVGPHGEEPRPHRLEIGSYRRSRDGLEQVGSTYVETSGPRTPAAGLPEADLHLVNDSDLTFAAARTDERSLRTMLDSAGHLPHPVSRALAVSTAWDMLVKGELATDDFLTCVLGVLTTERSAGVVEPFLALALRASEQWTRPAAVPAQLARLAERAAARAQDPEHRAPALRTLAASATTPEHFALLDAAAADDLDLAWRVLVRRSALGGYDADAVESLLDRDPDPDASVRALGVLAARPDDEAKAEVWTELFEKKTVPAGQPTFQLATAFWRPVQHDLLVPWAHRYLDEVVRLADGGMLAVGSLMRAAAPTTGDQAWVDRAVEIAQEDGQSPTVRSNLLTAADTMSRVLRARG